MKRTEWISCKMKPVHVGYYEVRLWDVDCVFSSYQNTKILYFDGKRWKKINKEPFLYKEEKPGYSARDQWRGLTTKDGK